MNKLVKVTDDTTSVSIPELIELCAVDPNLFESEFFPNTARQAPAKYHDKIWQMLESSARRVNIQVQRGGAKTSKLRMFMLRRIAYGLARTILYVGRSQDKAIQSVSWIRKQIEHNHKFAKVYKLSQGTKWQDIECNIKHEVEGHTVTILAYGVTGSIRGVNIEDYRPDLIILDDILDEENTATEDQRKKMENLVYGALLASLAPTVDAPDAKLVMLQTPLNRDDVSVKALKDPAWLSARFGCWTSETEYLADDSKESAWPERYPTSELKKLKQSYISRNIASVWYREYECKITSPETSSFKAEWLNYYNLPPDRNTMYVVGAIDPVPPPTELQLSKGLKGKDYEALVIMGLDDTGKVYLLDYAFNRGHEPSWTVAEFFRLGIKWQPSTWVVEAVGYQKTLEWLLRKAMRDKAIYFPIYEMPDRWGKFDRIVDSYSGIASNGAFYVSNDHHEFVDQFVTYPDSTHVDILDAGSMALVAMPMFGIGKRAELSLAVNNASAEMGLGQVPGIIIDQGTDRPVNFHYGAP